MEETHKSVLLKEIHRPIQFKEKWDTIENVCKDIKDKGKLKKDYEKNKELNSRKIDYLYMIEDPYNHIKDYWKTFGYFSKSKYNSFLHDIMPALSVERAVHHDLDVENNDHDHELD